MPQFADDKRHEASHEHSGGPPNPGGAEPVIFLTFVENDLQAAKPYSEQAETNAVEFSGMSVFHIRWVLYIARDHENRKHTDRDIDVKSPPPGISVGEPAAES